jgi:hypothetical protein
MQKTDDSDQKHLLELSQDKDRLWDEYKYRHQHVWATVFKLTAGVVLVSIVPYTNREASCVLDWLVAAPPVLASGLAVFGQARMKREIAILMEIRAAHRKNQGLIDPAAGSFGKHVDWFLKLLAVAAVANAIVVVSIWRPAIRPVGVRTCFAQTNPP